jgi:hypothetical protein
MSRRIARTRRVSAAMPRRRSLHVADTLTPSLLGRETLQLALVAALTAAAFLFAPSWLRIVAAVVDAAVALACVVALVVAWRNARLTPALAVYAPAAAVFTMLGILNIWG